MSRTELDRQMRSILAKLELVSHGSTVSYNSTGGGGGFGTSDPLTQNAGRAPSHLHWAREYGVPFMRPTPDHPGARDDDARAVVISDARTDLETITGHGAKVERPQGETADQRDQRICREGEGYTLKEAAIKFRCGERDVRKARLGGGLDPMLGKAPAGGLAATDRRRRAHELREQSHSVASIALLLKVSKATVKRDLRTDLAA